MRKYVRHLYSKHASFWKKEHGFSLLTSLLWVGVALVIQRIADIYVGNLEGTAVNDAILSVLPAWDIDNLIILSTLTLTFIMVGLFVAKPAHINFGLKTIALFIIVRSFFISLTHLGSNPHELQFSPESIGYWLYNVLYNTHGDFFFSGHTGLPFITALIFWREKGWRIFFLSTSAIFGFGVLIAHIHYSIDVFAAPFMAYSIFSLAKHFFKKDAISAGLVGQVK